MERVTSRVEKMAWIRVACVSLVTPRGKYSAYIDYTDLHVTNVTQPILERRRPVFPFHRSPNATAVIVTTDDNVRDFENIDGELQRSHQVKVGRNDQVGNVTNNKDGSTLLSHDLVCRDTSIGTA
jgi:hypothetical protein